MNAGVRAGSARRDRGVSVATQESRVSSRERKTNRHVLNSGFWILDSVPRAFTLIELLTVIVIIAILAGLIIAGSKYALTKGATSRTRAEIASMETALESFKSDNGYYPATDPTAPRASANTNSPTVYTALAGGSKPYFTFKPDQLRVTGTSPNTVTNIVDPFGSLYNYYCNPGKLDQTNRVTFDLWSDGPDDQSDTADDITNWRQQ